MPAMAMKELHAPQTTRSHTHTHIHLYALYAAKAKNTAKGCKKAQGEAGRQTQQVNWQAARATHIYRHTRAERPIQSDNNGVRKQNGKQNSNSNNTATILQHCCSVARKRWKEVADNNNANERILGSNNAGERSGARTNARNGPNSNLFVFFSCFCCISFVVVVVRIVVGCLLLSQLQQSVIALRG